MESKKEKEWWWRGSTNMEVKKREGRWVSMLARTLLEPG